MRCVEMKISYLQTIYTTCDSTLGGFSLAEELIQVSDNTSYLFTSIDSFPPNRVLTVPV